MAKKSINIGAIFDLKRFSDSSQNLQRELRKSGRKMQSIGRSMTMSLTAPIAIMGGLAVKTFATFEQSMAKVQAISGAVGQDFQNLTNLAKDLGIATRFSASEVSDLMLNYSKLGFSSEEIQKITGATLDLALATGEDLARSAEVAGATLRAFGLDATDMVHLTDVMANSFSSSALDLDSFTESMKYVAPIAKAAGVSVEETSAMLSVLANNGIKGSQAGTALKKIISEIGASGKPTNVALKELAATGLNLADAEGEVGDRAKAALLILADGASQIDPLTEAYKTQTNVAKDMAAIMDDTLEGSMMRLKSATEGLAISFGEIMAPAVGFVADVLSKIAMRFANVNPYVKTAITVFAGLVAVLGPLAFAIGGIKLALATLMANPIILWVVGISAALAGLVAVFMYVKDNAEFFADFFYNLWVNIANNTLDAVKTIAKGLAKFAGLFGIDIGVDAFFDKFKLEPRKATKELKSFKETLKGIKNEVTGLTQAGEGSVLGVTPEGVKNGKTPEKLLSEKESTKKVSTLKAEINDIMKGFQPEIIPVVKVDKIAEQLKSKLEAAKPKFVQIGEQIGEALSSGLKNLVQQGAVQLGEFLGDALTGDADAKDFGKGLLSSIGGFMKSFGEAMIAIGIAESAIAKSIALGPAGAGLAIAGGIALIAAGAALSNLSKKGIQMDGAGGSSPTPTGAGFATPQMSAISLETKISGRDLILVQNREKGFTR